MGVLTQPKIEYFDVVANSFEQISDGSQQPRDVGRTGPGGIRQTNMAALPWFGVRGTLRS